MCQICVRYVCDTIYYRYVSGFSRDLVEAVCAAAGVRCEMIWDKYVPKMFHICVR